MTKQAHKNMNTNIDVIIDVRQQRFRNTQKWKAFCVAYVQKKRNTPTFHDFDWSLPEQRFAFFQQYISYWTPTLDIRYLPKKIDPTLEMPFFCQRTKRRTDKLVVVLKDAGVEQLCRFAVERWRRPLPLTDWHDGRTEAERPAKDPAGPEHTHTHTHK